MGRFFVTVVALASLLHATQKPAEPAKAAPATDVGPKEVVQQLFAAMEARDALAAKELFMPEAGLFSVGATGKANKMPLLDFLNAIGSGKAAWKERMWNEDVQVHGVIAIVWGPYDFHNNGAFSHCGYDSFSLLKTAAGWKISYISDTRETEGCVNPLGPPGK
jgi:hypothetical protein